MKILVAADFSDASKLAVEAAAKLCQDTGAKMVLMHVATAIRVPANAEPDPISKVQSEINEDEAVTLSTEWAAPLREQGLDVETVMVEGKPAEAILAAAAEKDVGLIVLGRRGWGKVKRFMLGSVTEDVVRRSEIPVLVVPA